MPKKKSVLALNFGTAFRYPFNNWKRMFNVLWILLPIFGWFALGGYGVRIVREFVDGKFKGLPEMMFGSDMKLGFFMFLKAIPFILAYFVLSSILGYFGFVGVVILFFIEVLVIPILGINFMVKQTVGSFFEFGVLDAVFSNLGDYIVTILKSFLLAVIFILMILILVGIPASIFTQNIFLADFYRRYVK